MPTQSKFRFSAPFTAALLLVAGLGCDTPPALSADASLATLAVSTGALSPTFDANIMSYRLVLPFATSSLTVTPTAGTAGATIKVAQDSGTWVRVMSGTASAALTVPQAGSPSLVRVQVTAEDGVTSRSYDVVVTRSASSTASLSALTVSAGTLSPAFDPTVTSYAAALPFATSALTVTPTAADATATITVSQDNGAAASVTSGSASGNLTVPAAGAVSLVRVRVTAQDGVTAREYAVLVRRTASTGSGLSSLTASVGTLSPAFDPTVGSYSLAVPFATSALTVTPTAADATATITVSQDNGAAASVTSGSASGNLTVPAVGAVSLVRVRVTAQDGVTAREYVMLVSRTTATSSSLTGLTPSAGTMSPTFAPGTTSYAVSLPYGTASLQLTLAASANAIITLSQDGAVATAVTSGSASSTLTVQGPGKPSIITLVVTAQDGIHTTTYVVTVTELSANDASLASLTDSTGLLTGFASGTLTYSFLVSSDVTSLTVTPTATDPLVSSITVNQASVASGSASGSIALNAAGTTVISIVVVSRDQTTSKTYVLNVGVYPPMGLLTPRTVGVTASTPLAVAAGARLPLAGATEVPVDTLLRIGFDATPSLGATGTIKIFRSTDKAEVDSIKMDDPWAVYDGSSNRLVSIASTKVNVLGAGASGTDYVRVVNYIPVMVGGNTVTIYPHNNKLAYNTTYYVTIDSGVVTGTINGTSFGGIAAPDTTNPGWTFTIKASAPVTFNVAADNSADFATVQGAIDAVPRDNSTARTINIAPGVYQELLFIRQKYNLTFKGADNLATVIQYDNCDGFNPGSGAAQAVTNPSSGSSTIPTINVAGGGRAVWYMHAVDNVVLDSITVKNLHAQGSLELPDGTSVTQYSNSTTPGPTFQNYSSAVTQAETIYFDTVTTRFTAKHSNFVSYQDTLQLKGYAWLYDCFVTGDSDFIWGYPFAALFERCEIKSRNNPNVASVVQSRAYAGYAGFVFLNSALTKESGTFTAYLARSPGSVAVSGSYTYKADMVTFINSSMDTHIAPAGWNVVGGNPTAPNQKANAVGGWREYMSRTPSGTLLDVSSRLAQTSTVNGSTQLGESDVATFFPNRGAILSGATNGTLTIAGYSGGWNPAP